MKGVCRTSEPNTTQQSFNPVKITHLSPGGGMSLVDFISNTLYYTKTHRSLECQRDKGREGCGDWSSSQIGARIRQVYFSILNPRRKRAVNTYSAGVAPTQEQRCLYTSQIWSIKFCNHFVHFSINCPK